MRSDPHKLERKSAENCFERCNYQHLFKNLSSFFTHAQKNHQKVVTWDYCSPIFASFLSFVNHLVSDYSVDQRSKCEYLPSKSKLPLCKFNRFCCYAFKTAPSATQRTVVHFILSFYSYAKCSNTLISMATITNSYDYSAFKENNRLYLHYTLFCWV